MPKVNLEPVRAHVEILRMVKRKKAELKELEANSRAVVEEAMGDNESGELDGKPAIEWPRYKKRQFRLAALRDAHPEIAEEYTELVEAAQFNVVDE